MERIKGAAVGPCASSPYLQPLRLHDGQPGRSLEEVACKEVWEECGYRLAPSDLRRVATSRSGVGLTRSCQTTFHTADVQHSGPGGGRPEEGELIEIMHLPQARAQAFVDSGTAPGL